MLQNFVGRFSVRTMLVCGAMLIAAIPALVMGLRSAYLERNNAIEDQIYENELLAKGLASEYGRFAEMHLSAIKTLAAHAAALKALAASEVRALQARTLANYPSFDSSLVIASNGKSISYYPGATANGSTTAAVDLFDRPFFKEMRKARRATIDRTVMRGRVTGRLLVAVRAPIVDASGAFKGIASAAIDLEKVRAAADRIVIGRTGGATVVTSAGIVIAHRNRQFVQAQKDFSRLPIWPLVTAGISGRIPSYVNEEGDARAAGFATVPIVGWKVWVSQSLSEIQANAVTHVWNAFSWAALALVAALAPMVLLGYAISRPVEGLERTTSQLADGDLSARVQNPSGPKELKRLSTAFNDMAASIEEREQRLIEVEAERRSAAARLQLATIVESSSDAIISMDLDGFITGWNPAAKTISGYSVDEVLGKHFSALLCPDHIAETMATFARVREGEAVSNYETVGLRKDGTPIEVSISAFSIRNPAGEISSVSCIVHDITERRRLEKERSDFIAMIVHDLRSPLSNIVGAAALIEDGLMGPVTEEQKKWLGKIGANVQGLVELVNDFLDLSKIEAGRIDLMKQEVDLRQLVGTVLDNFQMMARQKEISLQSSIAPALPRIKADPGRLEQVFTNLLSNAIKFTGHRGNIEVGAVLETAGEIELWVKDDGVGIDSHKIAGLFEKYRQVRTGISRHKGTGLGLVICKMIVEAHGGRIWVESKEGKGATFFFTLPTNSLAEKNQPVKTLELTS